MKRTLLILLTMNLFGIFARAEPLSVGDPAPNVSAIDQDGALVQLGEVSASGITLVYFYPKADTPGCTAQACSLRDSFADLKADGLRIYGVSHDTPAAQKKFREKHNLPFPLLSDTEGKVAAAFGVPTTLGFSSRQSFVLKDGRVAWTSLKAGTRDHAAEVQAALNSLK